MHQQRPAILPWRSSLSDANGQFMAPVPFSAASCRRTNSGAIRVRFKTARDVTRADVNGGY
jgi:hypothetical protein